MDMDEYERIIDAIGTTVDGEDVLMTLAAMHQVMTCLLEALVESGQHELHNQCCSLLVTDFQAQRWQHSHDIH